VKANGVDMEPTDSLGDATILQTGCQGLCRLSGTWWLALDLAEKAHPGMFVNVPIDVTSPANPCSRPPKPTRYR
jgi:hypothetical protein